MRPQICQDSSIILSVPTGLAAELWGKDEDVAVGAIIVVSTLLDPRSQLQQEQPHVNDQLIPSKEQKVGDRVGQGGNHQEIPVIILADKR